MTTELQHSTQRVPRMSAFEAIRRQRSDGTEYWSARDLQTLLGYEKWERMNDAIVRAMTACENSGQSVADHFPGAGKMVEVGSGAERTVLDYHLSRYGAYLVAMNSDPRKPEVAGAQSYFAVQTHAAELQQAAALILPSDPVLAQLQVMATMRAEQLHLEQRTAQVEATTAELERRLDLSPIQGAQIGTLHGLCQELGRLMGNYRRAYRLFYDHFGLASYRDVPQCRYEEAVRFVRVQISAYSGRPLLEERLA